MSAIFSPCGHYRYLLTRRNIRGLHSLAKPLGSGRTMAFVMLNPSTADSWQDDPTLRRCLGFARRESCDHLLVVNLYAYVSPYPCRLSVVDDPIGPENELHVAAAFAEADALVAAWGCDSRARNKVGQRQIQAVRDAAARGGKSIMCLGESRDGMPLHPLYLRGDAELRPWQPRP